MGQDTTEVRAGLSGTLYVAAVGATAPTNTTSAWAAGWTDLGLLSEEGPTVQPSMETKDFPAWQEFFPVRTTVTARGMEWTFSLIQKNGTNLKLAFGGGTITDLGNDEYKYEPPATSDVDYRAFGLEVVDGAIIDRYVLERGLVTNIAAVPFRNDELVKFDLTVRAAAAPGADDLPWFLISNDTAMAS